MLIPGINNAPGVFKQVSDFRTGVAPDGELIPYGGIYIAMRANAAITKGQALSFVVPTASVQLSVTPRATIDKIALFAGIAMNTAASGAQVIVCVYGHCLAAVHSGTTAAAGEYGIFDGTNAGVIQRTATEIAAADLNGSCLGAFLGTKDSNNLVSFWLNVR